MWVFNCAVLNRSFLLSFYCLLITVYWLLFTDYCFTAHCSLNWNMLPMTDTKRPRFRGKKTRSPSRSIRDRKSYLNAKKRQQQLKKLPVSNGRLVAVWLVLVMGILGLAWRLYQLQIVQTQELQKRARQQQTTSIRPYIPRRRSSIVMAMFWRPIAWFILFMYTQNCLLFRPQKWLIN
jgi:hypothetical protein